MVRIVSADELLRDVFLRSHNSRISVLRLRFRLKRTRLLAGLLDARNKGVDGGVFGRRKDDVRVELVHQTVLVVLEDQVVLVFVAVRPCPNLHLCLEDVSVEVAFEVVRMGIVAKRFFVFVEGRVLR